ncbi:hypothetical protein [Sphingomonas sp. CFBP 13720]|uniref:hypothetical protein n=1 Tax=Sphingomonas sp. CFBP 13720 TaxID=2775302 RepID=UPI001784943F|nr:hypothetical protein [Sphingomonas sp. CFBP 13720]MBD8679596.1 hypothetical protein [Sphingomonas sp. CFBP 13720]
MFDPHDPEALFKIRIIHRDALSPDSVLLATARHLFLHATSNIVERRATSCV